LSLHYLFALPKNCPSWVELVTLGKALAGDALDAAMLFTALLPADRRRCANAIIELDFTNGEVKYGWASFRFEVKFGQIVA